MRGVWKGILPAAVGIGAAVVTAWTYRPAASDQVGISGTGQWREWCGLSRDERLAYVRRYEALRGRADIGEVWRRCAAFAALSPTEQQRRRELREAMEEVLRSQTPARRRALLGLHERARAEQLYRLLEEQSPDTLRMLSERLKDVR